jgi:16S rRNA (adenine1518-N6/adenine1519-N6)-dimethyltransferase
MPENDAGETAAGALRRHGLSPRKRLGQNFLRDRKYLHTITEAADLRPGDRVLEIGAGTGILTRALAGSDAEVLAVELDDNLYDMLTREYAAVPNVRILHANALDIDPCEHFDGPYKLIGNIPYYITGPILRHFLEARCPPSSLVLMVQREVAQRMTAAPGDLSLLGVSVQFYTEPKIVARVPSGAFYPPPKVESAIIRLVPHPQVPLDLRDALFTVARAGFGTRRKQLANALSHGLQIHRETALELLAEAEITPTRRAETLTLPEWQRLASVWQGKK